MSKKPKQGTDLLYTLIVRFIALIRCTRISGVRTAAISAGIGTVTI